MREGIDRTPMPEGAASQSEPVIPTNWEGIQFELVVSELVSL